MRFQLFVFGFLIACISAVAGRAEIIIDHFDVAFEINLPEMANRPYIVQSGIGQLDGERWSNVVAFSSRPTGLADANLSRASALTFEFDRLNRTPDNLLPVIGLNLLYFFDEIDITQSGANDRVVVDFAYLRSAIPLAQVSIFVQDVSQPGTSFGRQIFDIPANEEPFVLEFPLVSFGPRGGGAGQIDYKHVYQLSLNITPVFFNDIEMVNFSTAVVRVRFTGVIPEPAPCMLFCLGVFGTMRVPRNRR